MVRTLDAPLMYSVQVALAAERWRRAHGHAVRSWVTAIGEIEALLSFATYSYEHPADPFPEFVEGAAFFDGTEIGHPLVPSATCVRNSVRVGGDTRVLLVSGSNMSGKSTLLRSVGINVVLAMAGAPVRARALRLTPLRLGASIRINDSLQEGSSRFYAEITRLRKIFDLAGGRAGADVFAGRIAARNQLERSPYRRGRAGPGAGRTRGDWTDQHPRSGAHRNRRPAGGLSAQRPLSRMSSKTEGCNSTTGCARVWSPGATAWSLCDRSDWMCSPLRTVAEVALICRVEYSSTIGWHHAKVLLPRSDRRPRGASGDSRPRPQR